MRSLEQIPDLPLVAELGPNDEREVTALFGALVANGGFAFWAAASERARRALILGWVASYSTWVLTDRIAARLYTRMATECPTEGGAT